MTKDETMKLALEALENSIDLVEEDYANAVNLYGKYPSRAKRLIGMETMRDDHRKAITALREALAEQKQPVPSSQALEDVWARALHLEDAWAEPDEVSPPAQQCKWPTCQSEEYQQALAQEVERELIGEQPAQQEPVAWITKTGNVWKAKADDTDTPLYTSPPPQQEPVELCQYGQEPASCTSNPMDCQCAIDAALAQPEQEPVAWFSPSGNLYKTRFHATANGEQVVTPPYTTSPQRTWVGLTQEQIESCYGGEIDDFARAIEAKLREKNT